MVADYFKFKRENHLNKTYFSNVSDIRVNGMLLFYYRIIWIERSMGNANF
jgi:hypothetical protein